MMSQLEVYKILKELGGEATTDEISELAKKKFPEYTLHMYVINRLKKLKKKGIVIKIDKNKWKIIDKFP